MLPIMPDLRELAMRMRKRAEVRDAGVGLAPPGRNALAVALFQEPEPPRIPAAAAGGPPAKGPAVSDDEGSSAPERSGGDDEDDEGEGVFDGGDSDCSDAQDGDLPSDVALAGAPKKKVKQPRAREQADMSECMLPALRSSGVGGGWGGG